MPATNGGLLPARDILKLGVSGLRLPNTHAHPLLAAARTPAAGPPETRGQESDLLIGPSQSYLGDLPDRRTNATRFEEAGGTQPGAPPVPETQPAQSQPRQGGREQRHINREKWQVPNTTVCVSWELCRDGSTAA